MKIKLTYIENDKVFSYNDTILTPDNINTIIPLIFDIDNIEQYIEELSPYDFKLPITCIYCCDCCGTQNVDYEGNWQGIKMTFYETCYGNKVSYSCDDEKMKELLINHIDNWSLFRVIIENAEWIILDDGNVEYDFGNIK